MVEEETNPGKEAEPVHEQQAESAPIHEAARPEEGLESVRQELAQEREKAEKYLDNWRRAQADFINFKRRTEQQQEDQAKYANAVTVMNILNVLDDMERAIQTIPTPLAGFTWLEGIVLIYRKLQKGLEASGVAEVEAVGQPFDPNLHEAVMHGEGEDGRVIAQFQKGYKLHDRVIRPAMVAVGNGTKAPEGESQERESSGQDG